jgi:glutathione S-transferase
MKETAMLTLYHSPMCRSTRLVHLISELGAEDRVRVEWVGVDRNGSGPDRRNPHPEGKVRFLVHDGVEIWESTAIALYLTELFPETGLGVPAGDPLRGRYLSWLAWYGDVLEPLVVMQVAGLQHREIDIAWRSLDAAAQRLRAALESRDYLVTDRYTAADLIIASTFGWMPALTPDDPKIRAWVTRCLSRPAVARTWEADAKAMAAAA